MYYRKNGQIIRPDLAKSQSGVQSKENFEPPNSGFPIWLIVLIVLIVVIIAICFIWWIVTRKPSSKTPDQFGFKFY